MNAHEIHALSGAYALDALDPQERAQFEAHLGACTACQDEVASLREASAALGSTVEAAPPAVVRERVLAGIRNVRPLPPPRADAPLRIDRRIPRWRPLAAAAAVVALLGGGAAVWQQVDHGSQSQLSATERVLQARDAHRVTVDLPGGASASVIRSVSVGRAVLETRGLPAAPSGRVYELWLQSPSGTMVRAGLLRTSGTRTVVLEGDASDATAAGITVEPAGGSDSPTTAPIALFDFTKAI